MAKIPKNYWAEDDTTEGKFRIFSYPKYYKDDQEDWQTELATYQAAQSQGTGESVDDPEISLTTYVLANGSPCMAARDIKWIDRDGRRGY